MLPYKGVIAITGDGKGKTTNALGYAMHFLGAGKRVCIIQFLKGSGFSGELFLSQHFCGNFYIKQFGGKCRFSEEIRAGRMKCQKCGECFRESRDPDNGYALMAMNELWRVAEKGYDLFVLDEVAHAVRRGLLYIDELARFVDEKKTDSLIILTGRNMPDGMLDMSDMAVECFPLKHPKDKGIDARRGIEY